MKNVLQTNSRQKTIDRSMASTHYHLFFSGRRNSADCEKITGLFQPFRWLLLLFGDQATQGDNPK